MVFLHLTICAGVTNERSDVVDRNSMPLVHLGFGGVFVVRERFVRIKNLANTPHPVHTRTNSRRKILFGHLGRIVYRAIPFRRCPIIGADPTNTIWIMCGVRAPFEWLGGKRSPICLIGSVLFELRRPLTSIPSARGRVIARNKPTTQQTHKDEARRYRRLHRSDRPFFGNSKLSGSVMAVCRQRFGGPLTNRHDARGCRREALRLDQISARWVPSFAR